MGLTTVNKEQRNKWDSLVRQASAFVLHNEATEAQMLILAADVYIRKLERELQNIKQAKKIGAILKPK